MSLSIRHINKAYDGKTVFDDFSLDFTEGVITCILGPSGCGKTTLLNIIAGIEEPDSPSENGFATKNLSYIFQEPRLLPWKTVKGNIEFVMPDNLSPQERSERADELIMRVELEGFSDYFPGALSGGMKQRVSIARAMACRADVVLMDEPLNGLDYGLKQNLMEWLADIWRSEHMTVIFVTHYLDEALAVGDEVIELSRNPASVLKKYKTEKPLH